MNTNQITDFLLTNGNPSQKYMIKRDILHEDIHSNDMLCLQDEIIHSKPVLKLLKAQNSDGWFGVELHGGPGKAMDCTVELLHNLGVEPYHDFMKKAKWALKENLNPDPIKRKFLNDRGYDFSNCCILGDLQEKDKAIDEELISAYHQILENFTIANTVQTLDDISKLCTRKKYIGDRAYLKGKSFPWVSDFIVLSKNLSWKNSSSFDIVNQTLDKISSFMPIPLIWDVADDGHYVGPICNYQDFSYQNPLDIPKGRIVFWIRDFTRICKTCDISKNQYFYQQYLKFKECSENDTLIEKLTEVQLKAIEQTFGYYGKWKNETMQKADVYYLALLLQNFAGINE